LTDDERGVFGGKEKREMPTYEYQCKRCGEKFILSMPLSEHGKKEHHCPKCQSIEIEQLPPHVYTKTSKKS
jgi:putative FmdB family regulatory protein